MMNKFPVEQKPTEPDMHGQYHCGTLTYTKAGIALLFGWLLWGDFCYTLMETVVPSVVPLKLKALDCPNWLMGVIMTSLPCVLNMTICPWVSFKSDRHRGRWGRRIPFIVWTMPFLCACLVMLGCNEDIAGWLHEHAGFLRNVAPATLTIALIGIFIVMFQFFNMFVASVFWYLFNDVVPQQFLGRFIGIFKIVGAAAGSLYSYFIFQYAESHMREILVGAAVLYLVGFGLTCLKVKEGEYPPIEGESEQSARGMAGIRTFLKESFSHKFYWLVFLFTAISAFANVTNLFNVFFQKEMGLSLEQIGRLNAYNGLAVMVAMFFVAIFVDRWHPFRIIVYASFFSLVGISLSWVWIFVTLPSEYFFYLSLGTSLIAAFQVALVTVAGLPKDMRLFPQSRFGQFCSSQALLRSVGTLIAGVLSGLFIDLTKWFCHGSDFAYRFNFIWQFVFTVIALIIIVWSYRYWYQLGGDSHYHPPAPWSDKGVEEIPITTTIGPQRRWLNVALCLFDGIMIVPLSGSSN